MTHGSVFSGGAAGFDLAAEWLGWENVFHCEIDKYSKKLLKQRYPKAITHDDITKTDFTIYRGRIDVLSGGWPCQDNSAANYVNGQRGLQGNRSGLLREFTRAIREIRPRYAVGENVSNVLAVNGGRDFNTILSSLASIGYNATWTIVRASDIGAPHDRERLYLVAYPDSERFQTLQAVWSAVRQRQPIKAQRRIIAGATVSVWGAWQDQCDVLRMDDGLSDTAHRIKALGNAIVPEIAYEIFKAIQQCSNQ
jgi:DNA-cytosine methyltransferase